MPPRRACVSVAAPPAPPNDRAGTGACGGPRRLPGSARCAAVDSPTECAPPRTRAAADAAPSSVRGVNDSAGSRAARSTPRTRVARTVRHGEPVLLGRRRAGAAAVVSLFPELLEDQASPQPGIEVVIAVLALERGEGGLAGAMTGGNLGHSPLVVEALDEGGEDGIRSRH